MASFETQLTVVKNGLADILKHPRGTYRVMITNDTGSIAEMVTDGNTVYFLEPNPEGGRIGGVDLPFNR